MSTAAPHRQRRRLTASTRAVFSTKALFWLIGAGADAGAALTQHDHPRAALALAVMAAVALGLGLLTWLSAGHLPAWSRHLFFAAAVALCTVTVMTTTSSTSAVALAGGFSFVTIDALVFYPPRQAAAHLAVALSACTAALLARPDLTWGPVVIHDVVLLAPLAVVARLVRRARTADVDALTGLANRRGFDAALQTALSTAERTGGPVAVAVLDVDHFKAVNDAGGHAAGDALLVALAGCWSPLLPAGAVLARHGGDEFALVLPDHTGQAAVEVLERLREAAAAATGVGVSCAAGQRRAGRAASPRTSDGAPGSTAGGAAAGAVEGAEGGAELVRRVDAALYQAKAAGRGRSVLAGGARDQLAADLAEALRDALAGQLGGGSQRSRGPAQQGPDAAADLEGQLHVHYQPVVTLPDGEVVGVEALARWTHPTRGPVPPAEFVALAEAEDLIGALGAFVLARACTQAVALRAAAGRDLFLTVNASGAQLVDPAYPDVVAATLAATGWPAERLVLEVTESLIDADSAPALAALRRLAGLGLGVAVDDFGTGYSSLSRLDTLPATYLKLDSTFTATVTSPARARLVTAVVALAGAVGLGLVAEGVETPAQAEALVAAGAVLGQGYLYSRPRAFGDLLAELTDDERGDRRGDAHGSAGSTTGRAREASPRAAG